MSQEHVEIVAAGTSTLRAFEVRVRAAAAHHPEAPALWLTARDVAGLAGRLEAMDAWQWRTGFAALSITGQDLGVLDELALDASVDPDLHASATARPEERESLMRLRTFLGSYLDGEFEFDNPTAPDSAPGAPAA